MFINTIIKDSRKVKELEIMYQNSIYILFPDIAKFADFRWKINDVRRTQGVSRDLHIFGSSLGKV